MIWYDIILHSAPIRSVRGKQSGHPSPVHMVHYIQQWRWTHKPDPLSWPLVSQLKLLRIKKKWQTCQKLILILMIPYWWLETTLDALEQNRTEQNNWSGVEQSRVEMWGEEMLREKKKRREEVWSLWRDLISRNVLTIIHSNVTTHHKYKFNNYNSITSVGGDIASWRSAQTSLRYKTSLNSPQGCIQYPVFKRNCNVASLLQRSDRGDLLDNIDAPAEWRGRVQCSAVQCSAMMKWSAM